MIGFLFLRMMLRSFQYRLLMVTCTVMVVSIVVVLFGMLEDSRLRMGPGLKTFAAHRKTSEWSQS